MTSPRLRSCHFPAVSNRVQHQICVNVSPKLDLVFDRSIIALLLGLFRTDLLAREMSAVTLVIDILGVRTEDRTKPQQLHSHRATHGLQLHFIPKCKYNKHQADIGIIKEQRKRNAG